MHLKINMENFPGSPVFETLPSNAGACMHAKSLQSCLLSETLRTVARQASLSMEFSRQEYWSGLPCPPPGDLSNPGIEPISPALQEDSVPAEPPAVPCQYPAKTQELSTWYCQCFAMLGT